LHKENDNTLCLHSAKVIKVNYNRVELIGVTKILALPYSKKGCRKVRAKQQTALEQHRAIRRSKSSGTFLFMCRRSSGVPYVRECSALNTVTSASKAFGRVQSGWI